MGLSAVTGNASTSLSSRKRPNVVVMTNQDDVKEFLSTRRAKITPERAGLPVYGGNLRGVSDAVLGSVARTLQLDEAETAHLFDLARAANQSPTKRRRSSPVGVRPSIQRMLDAMTEAPAWVRNARHDYLAANRLGFALYSELFTNPERPANSAKFVFLNERSKDFFEDWERSADDIVAMLRSEAGVDPYDPELSDLIGELSTRTETLRTRWAAHNVRFHRTCTKRHHHPEDGDLELSYESMELSSDPGLNFLAYMAEPNAPSADGLRLLSSWAATLDAAQLLSKTNQEISNGNR